MLAPRYSGALFLAVLAVGLCSASPAAAETTTFTYTGSEQKFVVPPGISLLSVSVTGSGGLDSGKNSGGKAAVVTATIAVVPGQELFVEVGGTTQSGYGFGGGAEGGGGASDLRTLSLAPPNKKISPGSRLLVAGGGGGAASVSGAVGGDAGQAGGAAPSALACAGRGGSQLSGGLGGDGAIGDGSPGTGSLGGLPAGPGGGGGGGLFGGGGAGANTSEPFILSCAGGGGGSSKVPEGGTVGLAASSRTASQVSITYSPPVGPPPPDHTAPLLTQLTISPPAFKAARSGASISAAGGTVFYRLSEPARVGFRVERAGKGHRRGKRCLAGSGEGRKCTRYAKLRGSFGDEGGLGLSSVRFRGRLNGRSLAPGPYRLVAIATDLAGNSSKPATRSFRIVD